MKLDFEVSLDSGAFSSKQKALASIGKISKRIATSRKLITVPQLAKAIGNGQCWCPGVFNNGNRKLANFASLQVVAIDIDAGLDTLDDLVSMASPFMPAIVHESFSSAETQRKWRAIFVLSSAIKQLDFAYLAIRNLYSKFPSADVGTAEPARLMFGTTKDKVHLVNADAICRLTDVLSIEAKVAVPSAKPKQKLREVVLGRYEQSVMKGVQADVLQWLDKPHETFGNRYMALWTSSAKIAQLPFVDRSAIEQCLLDFIATREVWADWDKDPSAVIAAGIAWGEQHER